MFNTAAALSPEPIDKLWVLYDPTCGFCVSCRRWLERQPAWVPFEFLPAASEAASEMFPGLAGTREELTVIASDGSVYRSDSGWLMCLWALREYRALAERLSSPALLPYARAAFELVARNRKEISHTLGLLPEPQLQAELGRIAPTCAKPPLPRFGDEPERGGRGAQVVLAITLVILVWMLAVTFREPAGGWLVRRGIARDVRSLPLRMIGFDPAKALCKAAAAGQVGQIQSLVRAGADPNGSPERRPLFVAADSVRRDSVETLLALGASPVAEDSTGMPIAVSVVFRRPEMLPQLQVPPSFWSWRDKWGWTILARTVERRYAEGVRGLLAAGADANDGGLATLPLTIACGNGDEDIIGQLLAAHADPNRRDVRGDPPLVRLARERPPYFEKVADRLLAAGADVNARGDGGQTPLLAAATQEPDARTVKALLRRGADPNLRDESGHSPLYYATANRWLLMERVLLDAGADPATATAPPAENDPNRR
jgi:ankyrin repeat protein/predicted DCC family thiol-disulfide oxidoreductase YuxK